MSCYTVVHDSVCVDAEVSITPSVIVGDIHTYCDGDAFIGACPGTSQKSCEFSVSQRICVQIPLTFEANATATPLGISCGIPDIGICPITTSCTYTIGYFKNHPEVIKELLATAGGSIVLGNSTTGLGYTVTTAAEAVEVLKFNIPASALPTDYANQYSVLYAQLLAAKLNVLNGANCANATIAIMEADSFLATSPPEGKMGAPDLQDVLETFNSGNLEDCPEHCE
jgi:hypothetical protein